MNEPGHRTTSRISKFAASLWAASFLFFLLYSAPHQVHHVFEQSPQAHHHDGDHHHPTSNRHHRSSTDSHCVFQISASRCHLGLTANVVPSVLPILIGLLTDFHSTGGASTNLIATFHIRAPPLA